MLCTAANSSNGVPPPVRGRAQCPATQSPAPDGASVPSGRLVVDVGKLGVPVRAARPLIHTDGQTRTDRHGLSRFSRMKVPSMPWFFDRAGLRKLTEPDNSTIHTRGRPHRRATQSQRRREGSLQSGGRGSGMGPPPPGSPGPGRDHPAPTLAAGWLLARGNDCGAVPGPPEACRSRSSSIPDSRCPGLQPAVEDLRGDIGEQASRKVIGCSSLPDSRNHH
jgi:hypothetical protein